MHNQKGISSTAIILIIIMASVFIIGGAIFYFYVIKEDAADIEFIVSKKRNLIQEVSVTGRVNPIAAVNLAFETSGKLEGINVQIGNSVKANQIMLVLDDAELQADLAKENASLDSAKATLKQYQAILEEERSTLADLERGTRKEEITIQEIKVTNAKIELEQAKNEVINVITDAYTKSDDAVRTKLDIIFNNPRTDPTLNFNTSDSKLKNEVETSRSTIESIFVSWNKSINKITVASDLFLSTLEAKDNLTAIKNLLDNASLVVNSALTSVDITSATLDTYKSNISTARTNINTAFSNVLTKEEKLNSALSNLAVEKNELNLLKAGTVEEKILAQKAQVRQAEANLDVQEAKIKEVEAKVNRIRTLVKKTVLRSPIDGIVTKLEVEVGEIVSANTNIITVISESEFEIETNIPEADIAKVEIEDTADVTLDAYGDDIHFVAKVIFIDPAETIVESVATYKVTLQFVEGSERVKSGMTANIDIITEKREGVIAIPQRAVFTRDREKYVKILVDKTVHDVQVETGIRGSDGTIEIIEGLNEGDKVITFSGE